MFSLWQLLLFFIVLLLFFFPTSLAAQEEDNQTQTTLILDFNKTDYSFVDTQRQPIVFGEPISWKLLLLNETTPLNMVYETPAIYTSINKTITDDNWSTRVDFVTEYDQIYTDIPFSLTLPSASILDVTGDVTSVYFSENQLDFVLPRLDNYASVSVQGNFVENILFDYETFQDTQNQYTARVQGALIETFEILEEELTLVLTHLEATEEQTLEIDFPHPISETTTFWMWNKGGTEKLSLPYKLSEDQQTVVIDWTFYFNLTSPLTRERLTIFSDVLFLDELAQTLLNQTLEELGNQTIILPINDTQNLTENLSIDTNITINFSFSTAQDNYLLGEEVEFLVEPQGTSSFFYIFTPEDDVLVLKEPLFTPTMVGNFTVEASLYHENETATQQTVFEVVENVTLPLNITNITNMTNTTNITNVTLLETEFYNKYPGNEGYVQAELALQIRNATLVQELREREQQRSLQQPQRRMGAQETTQIEEEVLELKRKVETELKNRFTGELRLDTKTVKKFDFEDLYVKNNTISLGIEDLDLEEFEQSYAVDPEQLDFEKATITIVAKGEELYKCADWDFATSTCPSGDWQFVKNIEPGKEYTYELSPLDPGFGEKTKSDSNQFLVQRGTASGSTTQFTDTLTTPINTSQSFLIHYPVTGSATPDDWQFTGTISSSTGVTFDSYTAVAANVYWEVVTSENLFVQRGQETLLTNNASTTVTLSDSVNTSRSFVIVNGRCNSSSNTDTRGGFFLGRLTSTTTLELERGNADLCDSAVDWQVVEWLGATVQSGTTTIANNTDSSIVGISSVNLSNSFLVFGKANYGSDTGMDSNNVQGSFISSTQLNFTQEPGSTYADSDKDIYWYVISVPELTVQSNTFYIGATSATTPITSVNRSRSFTSASWWSTGGGQTWGRGQSGVAITADNTLTVYKGQTNQNNDVSWFVMSYDSYDKDYAIIDLNAPVDNTGLNQPQTKEFNFTATDDSGIESCSLIIDGSVVNSSSSISNATPEQLSYTFPSIGKYAWSINCTEEGISQLEANSSTRHIHVFDSDTLQANGFVTNLELEDVTDIIEFAIKDDDYGSILYTENFNLSGGSNLDTAISFSQNQITVNTGTEPRLNATANLTILNLSFATTPVVLKDSVYCTDCTVISYDRATGNFTFSVNGFSSYTAGANAQLTIGDTTDSRLVFPSEEIVFYANYSNTSNSEPLNGTGFYCEFTENATTPGVWSTLDNLSFNDVDKRYKSNLTFLQPGTYQFNVSCQNTQGYENLSLTDDFSVGQLADGSPQVTLIKPPDLSTTANTSVHFTCNASDDNAINNISLFTNTSESWEYINSTNFTQVLILNATWGEDVLTTGEFPDDGEDALGQYVGKDYRIVERFDLSSLDDTATIVNVQFRAHVDFASSSADHRVDIHPYYNNVSYDPQPDGTTNTYNRIDDGSAFASGVDMCSSVQGTGYSSWIDLGNIAAYYLEQSLTTTDYYSLGLLETGEDTTGCQLAEYTATDKDPQLRIVYVPSSVSTFEANFTIADVDLGSYAWNCLAVDSGEQEAWSTTNNTFTRVQSYEPMTVNLVDPSNGTTFLGNQNNKFNVSASDDDGLATCDFWTDGTGTWSFRSQKVFSGTSDWKEWTFSGFTNGTHIWNAYCCDVYDDCSWNATNSTFIIDLDYTPPNVTAVTPLASTSYNLGDTVIVTANVSDDRNVSTVEALVEWNGGSQTYDMNDTNEDGEYNVSFVSTGVGRNNITIRAYDIQGNLNNTQGTWINVTYTTSAAIYCETSPCIADSSLILSRGTVSPSEPNYPNTLDACTDGNSGTYQDDENLENITITSLNGSDFRAGDTVEVNITAYCWSTGANDNINFIYANNSTATPLPWRVEAFESSCPAGGYQVISKQFVLDRVLGRQAFRGIVQYDGNTADTCGTGGYDDNDDVEFLVKKARESDPPHATLIEPERTTTYYYADNIHIEANVSDQSELGRVYVKITKSPFSWEVDLSDPEDDGVFVGTFSNTFSIGNHTIQLFTIDEFGNENNSETDWFMLNDTGTLTLSSLGCDPSIINATNITFCQANITDEFVPLDTIVANVTLPDDSVNQASVSNVSSIYSFTFTNTSQAGDYDVLWWVNNTNGVSRTDVDLFKVNELNKPNVTFYLPTSGKEFNTSQDVTIEANVTDDTEVDFVYAHITLPDMSTETENLTKQANNITYSGSYYLASQFGNYTILILANDTSGNMNNTETTWINVSYVSSGALFCSASPCIVNSSLILSRGTVSPGEPNAPNTLDSCSDGGLGTYQDDENLENITMRSLNGSEFRGGDTVEVNITAYCWNTGANDNTNFVYANDSSRLPLEWKVMASSATCPAGGYQTITRQFVLDRNPGVHAFRGIVQYDGNTANTCGTGDYDDNDDFEFSVGKPRESDPPEVTIISPNQSRYNPSSIVLVRLEIIEATDVEFLEVNISWNSSQDWQLLTPLQLGETNFYEINFTDTTYQGSYNLTVFVNDTFNNTNATEYFEFEVSDATVPVINSYTASPTTTVYGNNLTISANVTDDILMGFVQVEIDGTNQSMNNVTEIYSYTFNTSTYVAGFYTYVIYANDSVGNDAVNVQGNFTIEKYPGDVVLYLNGTQDNFSMYPNDAVNISAVLLIPESGGDVLIYNNGSLMYNDTSPSENLTVFTETGYHNITAIYEVTENYTGDSETFYVIVNAFIPPNITPISPLIDSGDNDGNVTFAYTVTGGSVIENCSVYVDDEFKNADESVTRDVSQYIDVSGLSVGKHTWYINCTDPIYTRSSPTWSFDVINTTLFGGMTTNFSTLNVSAISNFFIDTPGVTSINYTQTVNLSGGADINSVVTLNNNNATVDSNTEPRLNYSAEIFFYDLPFKATPVLLRNGQYCSPSICSLLSYKPLSGELQFSVAHFTSYTARENAQLELWDETDAKGGGNTRYVNDQVKFYTNYTDWVSGESINGTDVFCEIEFNTTGMWSSPVNMTFNATSLLYEYNRSFSSNGTFPWRVSCDGIVQDYEPLNTTDDVTIASVADVLVNSILLSNYTAIEGEMITLSVNITNNGSDDATDFYVQLNSSLWNGTKMWNQTQTSPLQNLSAQESKIVNFTWVVKIGTYIFDAFADSTGVVFELNETNNLFSENETTSSWEIFYGDYDYTLLLADVDKDTLVNWTTVGMSGNLFFSDADATWDPWDLEALNGADDLKELDAALGLTGYNDSVSALFDPNDDGWADQTASFVIAGQTVTGVPIIQSTNSSSFVTGILWDGSDAASYSGGVGQDVVFVTKLNASQVGYYGTYDFEARIPSPLARIRGFLDEVTRVDELI